MDESQEQELDLELNDTPPQILGKILKKIRDKADLTQGEMGKRLGFEGATVITHMERGVREVRLWEFVEFCRIAGQKPDSVLSLYLNRVPEPFIWPAADKDAKKGRGTPQNLRRSRKQKD